MTCGLTKSGEVKVADGILADFFVVLCYDHSLSFEHRSWNLGVNKWNIQSVLHSAYLQKWDVVKCFAFNSNNYKAKDVKNHGLWLGDPDGFDEEV